MNSKKRIKKHTDSVGGDGCSNKCTIEKLQKIRWYNKKISKWQRWKVFTHKKTDLMVDLTVVKIGGKEKTPN